VLEEQKGTTEFKINNRGVGQFVIDDITGFCNFSAVDVNDPII